jgi:hypothetical protein
MMTGDRISWSNPRVLAVLLLVFVSGTLSGAIALRIRSKYLGSKQVTSSPPSWNNKDGFLNRCKKELGLSEDQAVKMAKVLDDYRMYYQNLQEQLEEVRSTGKNEILKILDEDQRQKFLKLVSDSK